MTISTDLRDATDGYEVVQPGRTAAADQTSAMLLRSSVQPSRRAVLHVQALGDPGVPSELVNWYTERAFQFYLASVHLPEERSRPPLPGQQALPGLVVQQALPGLVARRARPAPPAQQAWPAPPAQQAWPAPPAQRAWPAPPAQQARQSLPARRAWHALPNASVSGRPVRGLGPAFADLDAACACLREAERMDTVVVTAHDRGALAAALWADARQSGGADALILHSPALPARRSLRLRIGCPVLVLTDPSEPARATCLGGHVTWLQLEGAAGGPLLADGADLHELCGELGRWLGAYMYGQMRDRLL